MKYRRHVVALAIAAGSAAAAYGLMHVQWLQQTLGRVERMTVDYRLNNSGHLGGDSSIAIIMFDSASIRDLPYLMPFPRAVLADLVEAAAANGAEAIGLDVFLDRRYPELSERDDGDARLRAAIERAGNVVLVAPSQGSDSARSVVPPDPYFAEVAAAVGVADIPTAMDVLEDAALVVQTETGLEPGFALALHAVANGIDLDSLMMATARSGTLALEGLPDAYRTVPATGSLTLPIRFAGPPSKPGEEVGGSVQEDGTPVEHNTFDAYPASVIQALGMMGPSEYLTSWLGGRTVLLGSAFHDSERFRTAFYSTKRSDAKAGETYGWMYGVEVHANTLDNIVRGSYLKPISRAGEFLILLLAALVTVAVTFRWGAKWGALATAATGVAIMLGALQLFELSYTVIPMFEPVLALAFAFMSSAGYVSIVEGREKRMIRGAFSKYVPPDVVSDLVADPSRLRLGGEKRTISILFSDVAGFTSMSETLSPETLLAVLNEYLDEMSDIVFEERGTLDKYIGDAVMALYGAPTTVPDHALHACRSALRMQRRLRELNARWLSEGREWDALRIRIGVNTGTPVVGNIGGERRFDYTALGDAVNLAARLEPACKTYGVEIMIAEATRQAAGPAIVTRELDLLAVYGKVEPVAVFELVALAGEDLAETAELLELYGKGLAAYRNRDFELAIQYLNAALEIQPEDRPARLYRDRSEEYMFNPPPADWDFVERRQVK